MKIFIGMETSGALRRRFQAAGHDVISCDLLPSQDGGAGHIVGDVFDTLEALWPRWWPDLAIFHPDCTYLTNSAAWALGDGPYHQKVKPETLVGAARRDARAKSLDTVRCIFALPIRRKVIENPVGAISTAIRKPTQIIQPWMFGDDASKGTCLWFAGKDGEELRDMRLPVDPLAFHLGRITAAGIRRWSNQTDSDGSNRYGPSADRWQKRSNTFPGIADAMVSHFLTLK